jgi:PAS domain S-box-containing protein
MSQSGAPGGKDKACSIILASERGLLSAVIDQMPDDIVILDASGRVADVNRAAMDRLGGNREDFLGRPCGEALKGFEGMACPEGDPSAWPELRAGRAVSRTHSVVEEGGALRYFKADFYPVMGEGRELAHVLAVRRDVTQRAYMERRLRQSEKLAAVGELSTYVAHEIRNPMFAIAGFANSLLRSGSLDEKARAKVSIILEESNRLDKILKNLLNFARPTQGHSGQMDVNAVAAQTMELLALGCQKQGVEATVEAAPGLPKAKGDPELIKQCIINMAKNSMEAMPDGGRLTLRTYARGDGVVLEVADSGAGIAPEHLDQVFNPFFSTKDKGSGLGLAMTKKILDELGGSVEIESEQGKGTTVRLALPPWLAEEADAPDGAAAPRHDSLWRAGAR